MSKVAEYLQEATRDRKQVRVCFDRRILGDLERAELELQATPAPAEAEQLRRTVG